MRETHFDIFYEGGELSASHFPRESLETLVHSEFRSLLFLYSPIQIQICPTYELLEFVGIEVTTWSIPE